MNQLDMVAALARRIEALEQEVRELRARGGVNIYYPQMPPSRDTTEAPPRYSPEVYCGGDWAAPGK